MVPPPCPFWKVNLLHVWTMVPKMPEKGDLEVSMRSSHFLFPDDVPVGAAWQSRHSCWEIFCRSFLVLARLLTCLLLQHHEYK